MSKEVIIWGNDNYNLLGVLRQLVPYGINVFVVFNDRMNHCASSSRYCKNYVTIKKQDAINYFLYRYKDYHCKPTLIITSDEMSAIVDQNRNILKNIFELSGTNENGLLSKIQDKNEMVRLAIECGFNVPQSMPFSRTTDVSKIPIPCFIRSALNTSGSTWKGRVKCSSVDEVKAIQKELSVGEIVIVSEFVPKEYEVLVIGVRFHNGDVYIPGCFVKDRWKDGKGGTGSHGIITSCIPSSIDLNSIKSFFFKIDYYGQFSVEYGVVNNIAYFYEVNLRNDGTSDYFSQVGANINLAWVFDCCGEDVTNIAIPVQKEAKMIDEIFDYNNVKKGIVTKVEWKKQRKEASVLVYYNKHDIMPYIVMKWKQLNVKRFPIRIFSKILKILKIK